MESHRAGITSEAPSGAAHHTTCMESFGVYQLLSFNRDGQESFSGAMASVFERQY
jgi:hypothetical protein